MAESMEANLSVYDVVRDMRMSRNLLVQTLVRYGTWITDRDTTNGMHGCMVLLRSACQLRARLVRFIRFNTATSTLPSSLHSRAG